MTDRLNRRDVLAGGAALMLGGCGQDVRAVPSPTEPQEIGVNMYDLFITWLWGNDPRVSPPKFTTLGRLGIPFVRFPASGQFAAHWQRWEQDRAGWWAVMDPIFAAAEQHSVKLVPCVFWAAASLPAHVQEPVSAWGDPTSRTRRFARDYTVAMVDRYHDSPALLMWEFSNELNIWADWPDAIRWWPPKDPTAPHHNRPDDLISSAEVIAAQTEFAATVRRHDGRHLISTGGDLPHPAAWHMARGRGAGYDSPDEFVENLRALTPAACQVLSAHLYPARWGGSDDLFSNPLTLLQTVQRAALGSGRSAFLGEFGVPSIPPETAGSAEERRTFHTLLDAIRGSGIRYAALWDYDRAEPDRAFNVLPGTARAYQLDAILQMNREARRRC